MNRDRRKMDNSWSEKINDRVKLSKKSFPEHINIPTRGDKMELELKNKRQTAK